MTIRDNIILMFVICLGPKETGPKETGPKGPKKKLLIQIWKQIWKQIWTTNLETNLDTKLEQLIKLREEKIETSKEDLEFIEKQNSTLLEIEESKRRVNEERNKLYLN